MDEEGYLDLLINVLATGESIDNERTGVGTTSLFGEKLIFDLSKGFPLLTTKYVPYKAVLKELLFFISGETDTNILSKQGVKIWEGNTSREALDKLGLKDYKEGEMGPCFPPGTIVLTSNGYKFIEEVTIKDKLYTHTGQMKSIKQTQNREYKGDLIKLSVKYHPKFITSTPEHPYYSREFKIKDRYQGKRNVMIMENPKWIPAKELTKNHLIGFPIETKEIIPIINEKKLDNPTEWFMMGYFLGDGWVQQESKHCYRIVFAISDKQENNIVSKISQILNIKKTTKEIRTGKSSKYRCTNKEWAIILKDFGKYAKGKKIPQWVHEAPKEMIKIFLNGYCSADGCIDTNKNGNEYKKYTTVSKDIAYSLQRLYLKLGIFSSTTFQKRSFFKKWSKNDPRIIFQSDCYGIQVYEHKEKRNNKCFVENNYAWFTITDISTYEDETYVYNFNVEEDNSYTVENLSVHNCYPYQWRYYGGNYPEKKGFNQIQYVIDEIKKNPSSRRILLNSWNPTCIDKVALPPCHVMVQFNVSSDLSTSNRNKSTLNSQVYLRSNDLFLGAPFNIASYAFLTHLIAHITKLNVGKMHYIIGDAHIYNNHIDQVEEQINRMDQRFPFGQLQIKQYHEDINKYTVEDFEITNYKYHSSIKAPMAV